LSNLDTYLLGAGDHGHVLLDALSLSHTIVRGVVDPACDAGSLVSGISVIDEQSLLALDRSCVLLVNGVGGRNSVSQRSEVFRRYTSLGFRFRGVVHPSAIVARDSVIDATAQIMAGVVVQPRVQVGANTVINTSVIIEHDCVLRTSCFVGPRSVLSGRVQIDVEAFVGAGVTVLPGVKIGACSVVGAGSVVTRDVMAGHTVTGNPARSSNPPS
jgi:UDP-perosamine 4-acetyltransferase